MLSIILYDVSEACPIKIEQSAKPHQLKNAGIHSGLDVSVKDLSPKISWKTVLLVKYVHGAHSCVKLPIDMPVMYISLGWPTHPSHCAQPFSNALYKGPVQRHHSLS